MTELYGTASCGHTRELREWLEMRRVNFLEYDVEVDAAARQRMRELPGAQRTVPLLVEDGRITQVGWNGHGCAIGE